MPSFTELKRQGYCIQRSASLGASITLVARVHEYTATFECAKRCAEVLGERALEDLGDGILEVIPSYRIPLEDLCPSIEKLSKRYSVALVEYTFTKNGGQYVPLWRINRAAGNELPPEASDIPDYLTSRGGKVSTNLDDY